MLIAKRKERFLPAFTLLLFGMLFFSGCGIHKTLKVATEVCENATKADISPSGLPYRPADVSYIQGDTIQSGDFFFDLWLICDSRMTPTSSSNYFSEVEGLGVYSAWYYGGPKVEGQIQDYWGFEPEVLPVTGSIGPLYKAKSGWLSGINLPAETVARRVEMREPFRFQVRVESPVGINGAFLEFKLMPTQTGYIPVEINVESLSK